MKRFILTIAAVAITGIFFAGADLQASGPKGGSKSPSKSTTVSKEKINVKVSLSNHQRSYRGWSRYCWFPTYGCYGFYDPTCEGWYYWCEAAGQFQPISSMATNVPTTSGESLLPPGAVNVPTPGTTSTGSATPPPLPVPPAPIEMPPAVENP